MESPAEEAGRRLLWPRRLLQDTARITIASLQPIPFSFRTFRFPRSVRGFANGSDMLTMSSLYSPPAIRPSCIIPACG